MLRRVARELRARVRVVIEPEEAAATGVAEPPALYRTKRTRSNRIWRHRKKLRNWPFSSTSQISSFASTKYGVLEQADITDTEHCIAEDHLWAFFNATQADATEATR